jgi:hypothetical protein
MWLLLANSFVAKTNLPGFALPINYSFGKYQIASKIPNMTIGSWLLLSVFFWVSGYLLPKVLEPSVNSRMAFVPKWLYFSFGAPKQKDAPITVMYARSIYFQLMGLLMALYGLLLDQHLVRNPSLSGLLGFGICMLISGVVTFYLRRKRPFVWQKEKNISRFLNQRQTN